jgi:hypothetical protein
VAELVLENFSIPCTGLVDWTAFWSEFTSGMLLFSSSLQGPEHRQGGQSPLPGDVRETPKLKDRLHPRAIHLPSGTAP